MLFPLAAVRTGRSTAARTLDDWRDRSGESEDTVLDRHVLSERERFENERLLLPVGRPQEHPRDGVDNQGKRYGLVKVTESLDEREPSSASRNTRPASGGRKADLLRKRRGGRSANRLHARPAPRSSQDLPLVSPLFDRKCTSPPASWRDLSAAGPRVRVSPGSAKLAVPDS